MNDIDAVLTGVQFIVAELDADVDPFILFAALAEEERAMIAPRTRDALSRARAAASS